MLDFGDIFTPGGLSALGQVLAIDLMLAGDNVVVLGTIAAALPEKDRRRVLALGVTVALVCRIGFALLATRLLQVTGLSLAGGLLLLWVAWKLFRELHPHPAAGARDAAGNPAAKPPKSFAQAAVQVALADISMSLDNVLGVAGAAHAYPAVLLIGLALSVTLMAVAAGLIARFIERHRWIAYLGLVVILYVAGRMIFDGWPEVRTLLAGA